jgi:hypothetical protein
MRRVATPALPVENGAMARLWSSADSAAAAVPPPRTAARTRAAAPTAPPDRRDAHPPFKALPPADSPAAHLLATDTPRPAPTAARRPVRAKIPPPKSVSDSHTVTSEPAPKSTMKDEG